MTDAAAHHRSSGSPKAQRKTATSKAKGAVRAKSGCYTCRIRRKKCDEEADSEGNCRTCVRLRLECLGFGAKRPEWMRENNSVTELRERIKAFLAAQGMIKGHSGSGPRCAEQDPPVLVLSADPNSSSTPSPPTRTMSTSSGDSPRPSHHVTSNVREVHYGSAADFLPSMNYHQHTPQPHQQQLSPDSPLSRSGPLSGSGDPELMLPSYSHSQIMNPSLVPVNSSHNTWINPSLQSSFSSKYHERYTIDDDDTDMGGCAGFEMVSAPMSMALTPFGAMDSLVQHYMMRVLDIQYILADRRMIKDFIYQMLTHHEPTYLGVCYLASVHMQQMSGMGTGDGRPGYYHESTRKALQDQIQKNQLEEGDALAGLQCVSSYLFSGGRGQWLFFLNVARRWVRETLQNARRRTNSLDMYHGPESTRFIIRTTMWFDVIASITLRSQPVFLREYRELFGRNSAYIEDAYAPAVAAAAPLSMLSVMGCDNQTFLALAEISALGEWKEQMEKMGRLSTPELVRRGLEIETKYLSTGVYGAADAYVDAYGATMDERGEISLETRRRLTADVFRASARVYLHCILSGDHPGCPEIAAGVRDTIDALKRVPGSPSVARSVVRSVVFPICIAGCLTDEAGQREFLLQKLGEQTAEGVGNCLEVQKVIEAVWEGRAVGEPIGWREKIGQELLLLV